MPTGQPYTLTRYTVKQGRENAFKSAWETMARESMKHYRVGGNPRLLQDPENPRNFISYAEWINLRDIKDWMLQSYFKEFVKATQEICEHIDRKIYNVIVDVPVRAPEFEKVKTKGR
jgi:heme-degrading monooxygenase HmoA